MQTPGEQANQPIVLALHAGRYADAIAATRAAQAGAAETDFAVGEIILQGWADDAAVQRPIEALEVGIALLEKSALTGHPQALSGLSVLFFTGLAQITGGKALIARDPDLHACWKQAEALPAQAVACVARRKSGQKQCANHRPNPIAPRLPEIFDATIPIADTGSATGSQWHSALPQSVIWRWR